MKEMRTVKQSAEMLSHIALYTKETSKYYDGNELSDSSELSKQQRWIDELWLLSEELTKIRLIDISNWKMPITLAIRNAGESADMKVITLNKPYGRWTVKCHETPHYA